MKHRSLAAATIILCMVGTSASAQFKKLLQKAEQKANSAIDKSLSPKPNQTGSGTNGTNGSAGNNGSGNASNTTGGGLISTPPDVKANLDDAEKSYQSKSYGEARYSVQQAMLGVELEIGNQILKSLPSSIAGLNKVEKEDKVASSGFGWVGLTIERKYSDGKEKEFRVEVANSAAMMAAINVYLSYGSAQQTGGQQNWKQTKLKGYRAIIEYNEGSGYKLSVPIGQSSLVVFDGVNFASEPDMMSAAGNVDIDTIKKQLGEQ